MNNILCLYFIHESEGGDNIKESDWDAQGRNNASSHFYWYPQWRLQIEHSYIPIDSSWFRDEEKKQRLVNRDVRPDFHQ